MRIDRLTLKNFRGFADKTLEFASGFNVLIGDNGSGKTAALEALKVALSSIFYNFPDGAPKWIHFDLIRHTIETPVDVPILRKHYPSVVTAQGVLDGRAVRWQEATGGEDEAGSTNRAALSEIAGDLASREKAGQDVLLPLIASYGAGRLFLGAKQGSTDTVAPATRTSGYGTCLSPELNDRRLLEWFRTRELGAKQNDTPAVTVEGVRAAVLRSMGKEWRRLYYDFNLAELVAQQEGRAPVLVSQLSDGQRGMLALALDIAYRAATLNPHLGGDAPRETPGIVLIDEIDLHLHPRWQRTVVEDLRAAFPKMQFIVTTHSPPIVQSLRPGELIDLEDPEDEAPEKYHKRSVEDILEEVMEVPQPQRSDRSQRMVAAAEEYYGLLRQGENASPDERERLRRRLDELSEPFLENEAYVALLRQKRLTYGIDEEAPPQNGASGPSANGSNGHAA